MIVVGVDEAGRGPLAGPVVAASVFLTREQAKLLLQEGLNDSKKLSENKRNYIFKVIQANNILWKAQAASHIKIDEMNILKASLWAMAYAIKKFPQKPDLVLLDGSQCIPHTFMPDLSQRAIPKADAFIPAVMAASVIAKVLRDNIMNRLDIIYPGYGFAKHKGYPTKAHRERVAEMGLSPVHRKSFKVKVI